MFPGNIVIQNIKKKSAKEAGVAGAYARGKIYLYPDQLARNPFEKSGRFTKQEIGNQILCVLIHEETHATAKNQDTSIPSKIIKTAYSYFTHSKLEIDRSGYNSAEAVAGKKIIDSFRSLNEGITEWIAERVYDEYLQRTGDRATFSGKDGGSRYIETYPGPRAFVQLFVGFISQSTGIPTDAIEESLIQGYMSGIDLRSTEIATVFDEVFYPQFMLEVQNTSGKLLDLPFSKMMKHIDHTLLSDDAKARIHIAMKGFMDGVNKTIEGHENEVRPEALHEAGKINEEIKRFEQDNME